MSIQTFIRLQRPLTLILLPVVLLLLLRTPAVAAADGDDVKSANVKWATKADIIVINYDLIGSTDSRYLIDIVMKQESDPTFAIIPKTVEGDIGQGAFAGTGREIRWYFRRDYPRGFDGEGYYFEIHVKTISQQSNLLYYVLGGAALTGGVILLLAGKGSGATFNGNLELPFPPARP